MDARRRVKFISDSKIEYIQSIIKSKMDLLRNRNETLIE